ncbi:hypothetical protein P691DRAFT_129498 [Macrolepiota fuliginosa MF-IS2]|uniref:Uncharacterized protein n=1 Tax=Macrolepiota fuliginosa MF-IS2 TaxID=1400762 RepID=A0A9P5XCY4_9AGAR|nr:hypothetical protein P691DRAFT_129498 [Macrolepiota fuliginosa MF-IS2]
MPRRGDHYPVIAHRRYTEMVIATSHSISRHHHGVAIDGGPHCPNLSLCGPRVIDAHFHHTHRFMNKPPQVVFRLYRLGKLIPRQQRFQPKRPQCLPRPASIPLVPTLCPPGSIYITISTSICTRSASKPVQPQWSGPSFVRQPKDPALFRVASLHDTVGAVSANNCAEDARIASAFLILRNIFQRFAHLPRAGGLPYAAVIRHGAGPLDQAPNGSLSRLQCPQLLLDPGPPPNGSLEPTQEAYTSYIKSGCKRLKNFPVLVQFCSAPNLTVVLYPGFLFPVQRP